MRLTFAVRLIGTLALLYALVGLFFWLQGPPRPGWAGLAMLLGGFIGVAALYLGWAWKRAIREHRCPTCGRWTEAEGLCATCRRETSL